MPYPTRMPAIAKILEKVRTTITFDCSRTQCTDDQYRSLCTYSKYASSMTKTTFSGALPIQSSIAAQSVSVPVGLLGLQM